MKINKEEFDSIRSWLMRNARPLEYLRWQFHYEQGTAESVVNALEAYQNVDGGFGRGLEPDSWNLDSTAISSAHCVKILAEVGMMTADLTLVRNLVSYFKSTMIEDNWDAIVMTNNDYPHAPWWTFREGCNEGWGYNPAGIILGFLLANTPVDDGFFPSLEKIINNVIDTYVSGKLEDGEYYHSIKREQELLCLNFLGQVIEESQLRDRFDLRGLQGVMIEQTKVYIEKDTSKWMTYCSKPSEFIRKPESMFIKGYEELLEKELDFLLKSRLSDGVWDITWQWQGYESEFSISRNWWRCHLILENFELLKAFGRIEI